MYTHNTHAHIHIYTHTHAHTRIYIYTHVHAYTHAHAHMCLLSNAMTVAAGLGNPSKGIGGCSKLLGWYPTELN